MLLRGVKDPSKPRHGQPKLGLCFPGTGKRITKEEREQYHPDVYVQFQRKAWYDQATCSEWAVKEAPKLIQNKNAPNLLFADNLSGQTVEEGFIRPLDRFCGTKVHNLLANQTDQLSAIDAGYGALIKSIKTRVQDDWLTDPKHPERWEEWTGERVSASRKRIMLTWWFGEAHELACAQFDFPLVFTQVGHFITVDMSFDSRLKLQGVSHFQFEDKDAERDSKTGRFDDGIVDLTVGRSGQDPSASASFGSALVVGQPEHGRSDMSDGESISENGNSTTTEAGGSTDDQPSSAGEWANSENSDYHDEYPDWASEAGVLVGYRVSQKFNTGWSVGEVLGVEGNRRMHAYGQYFVKHPDDRYPFYDELAAKYYGVHWYLLKNKKACRSNNKRNKKQK